MQVIQKGHILNPRLIDYDQQEALTGQILDLANLKSRLVMLD